MDQTNLAWTCRVELDLQDVLGSMCLYVSLMFHLHYTDKHTAGTTW